MQALHTALGRVLFAENQTFQQLTVMPLVVDREGHPDYLSLDEALARGSVRITETCAAGEVPELLLDNPGDQAVLLLDGEELVGARQNRMLNLTILAPAKTALRLPVSCVEAGRWSPDSDRFSTRGHTIYAAGRARKAHQVTASLRATGTRGGCQEEVWDDIRAKGARMGTASETEAMADLYAAHAAALAAYVEALPPRPGQVGAVFAIAGEVRGVELFDYPATLRRLYPKLVRSYALDAVEVAMTAPGDEVPDPRPFLAQLMAATATAHPAVGEGQDWRLSGEGVTGGALVARGRLVHLCAFRLTDHRSYDGDRRDGRWEEGPRDRVRPGPRDRAHDQRNGQTLAAAFARQAIALDRAPLFDQPLAPKAPAFDFARVEGLLLGLAIGNALGNTTEGLRPEQRRARYGEIRDYLPHPRWGEPRGFPSSDTQLNFWTLEQLITDRGFDPAAVARRLSTGQLFDAGQTMSHFVAQVQAGQPWYACGRASTSNGALLRIAPLVIPHLRQGGTGLWVDAALGAMMTHNDRASTAACVAWVGLLWDLLDRESPPAPAWWLARYVTLARGLEGDSRYAPRGGAFTAYRGPLWRYTQERLVAAAGRDLPVREACAAWQSGAYLLETLPSVLYILMRHGHDPEEALVRAVNDTRDNDTIAALVGAAVGALHGRQGLPQRWIERLSGRTAERDEGRVPALIAAARAVFWE